RNRIFETDLRRLVLVDPNIATTFSQVGRDQISDNEIRKDGQFECFANPILQLLRRARLHYRHLQVLHQLTAVARNLGAACMWIVPTNDQGASTFAAQAELVCIVDNVDWISSNIQSNALHHSHRVDPDVQCTVQCGGALALIIRQLSPETMFSENVRVLFENRVNLGNRASGISRDEPDLAFYATSY